MIEYNDLGHEVIYVLVREDGEQAEPVFVRAITSLDEARLEDGNGNQVVYEQDLVTGTLVSLKFLEYQRSEKRLLMGLYKTGFKRETFEKLELRFPFQEQLRFPLAPELVKAQLKAAKEAQLQRTAEAY